MTAIILTSSALILLLIIIRKVLWGKISPTVQYALWLLVAARLLIPGTLFTSPISVMEAVGDADPIAQAGVAIQSVVDLGNDIPLAYAPNYKEVYTTTDNAKDALIPSWADGETFSGEIRGSTTQPSGYMLKGNWTAALRFWSGYVWLTGIALTGSVLLVSNLTFYLKLRRKRRLLPIDALPYRCKAPVYAVDDLPSPCMFGLFPPAIYVNDISLSPQYLQHILAHEDTHRRHGDHIWAILRSVCLTVHWYNPLVWWAAVLSRRDGELSCDAGAIRRLGEENRIRYGETLLRMVAPGRRPAELLRTATTMSDEKKAMTERISLIAKQPKMLKLTLAAVVLIACGAAVFFFGGAAEEPANPINDQITADSPIDDENAIDTDASTGTLDQITAHELYVRARAFWNWFEFGTFPTTGTTLQTAEGTMLQLDGFDTLEHLRRQLEAYFSPTLTEHLLTNYTRFQESDGKLFVLPTNRGSNIYAGKESFKAFPLSGAEAARHGYDCHIYSTTEVLDYDTETVLYQKRHDWYMVWNGRNHVFTSFGPYDDVDPQKYYNALTILEHCEQDKPITDWLPLLANLDWNAMYATRDQWPEGTDRCMDVLAAISEYAAGDQSVTDTQMQYILSATEGLDGAYSEQYQFIVYELYQKAPAAFANTVLESLSGSYQTQIIDYLRYEEQYHRASSANSTLMTRQEAIALLRQTMSASLSVSPASMHFVQPGQKKQLLLVNAYGISAASYSSSDSEVAAVDENGFVTAVSPGEATITLHYEGAAGQKDLTCAVSCMWGDLPSNTAFYTHSSKFFSLTLPSEDCEIAETSTGITITLDNESWVLRLLTQPSQWLEEHPSLAMVLGTFDTNGTIQTYLLETEDPDAPLTQQIADSFQLHVTTDMISQLIHESFKDDTAHAIQYLPYLSWLNYREHYGEYTDGGLLELLSTLRDTADSGSLSWAQYHDLLSVLPDKAIDGAFATMYQDTLQALHDHNPQQFASVLLSQFISPSEQENALKWLDMDLRTLETEAIG